MYGTYIYAVYSVLCDIKTFSSLTEYKKMFFFNCQAPELHLAPLQNLENLASVAAMQEGMPKAKNGIWASLWEYIVEGLSGHGLWSQGGHLRVGVGHIHSMHGNRESF
jgi:hypothetical protein